jgi:DNA-binding transcriptional LysR family regulator
MDRRWLPLNALRAFEAVAKHGSFTAAANTLLISQSSLSRHVLLIEKQIDTQLFERRPQALVLTDSGHRLLAAVTKSFDRLEHALDEIVKDGRIERRNLRIHLPPSFAAVLGVPILRDFRREFPTIVLDVVSPYGVGSPAHDVDLAVVYSKPTVTDAVSDLLWPVRLTLLCHPDLARKHAGLDLEGFINANELIHVRISDTGRHHLWTQFTRMAGLNQVNVERGLVFDTALMAAQYAQSGEGIALVDPNLFQAEMAEGRLVRPFDVALDDGFGYYLITHADDLGDSAIALLRLWLIQRLGQKQAAPERIIAVEG